MKIRRGERTVVDGLESGALTDLTFLLIIYFIVIAGFSVQQGFLLDLPGRNSAKLVFVDDVVRMRLVADGGVMLLRDGGEIPMPSGEIEGLIRGAIARKPNMTVSLAIDPGVPWQHVVSFVEMSQRLSVENFSFNVRVREGGEGG